MKYSVNVEDMNKLISQIQNDSDSALKKCWLYLEWKIKEQMKEDSYDTWHLAESINTQKVDDNKVIVWTNLEYALIREYGRRPWKFPPLDVLVWWTARKGMITGNKTAKYRDLPSEDKGVVFVIARAIARNWIQWKHTFERVINRERQNIANLYVKLMNQW